MNLARLLLVLILTVPLHVFGQICKGRIVDAKTDKPIPYANVFLHGSLIGTITNTKGQFELDCKGNTALPMVVSCLGYQTVVVESDLYQTRLKILLYEKLYEIDEVNVNGTVKSAWKRKKMVRVFKKEFVGSTRIAKACEILNIADVHLYYNGKTKTLYAKSESPILIRNKSLGYNVSFGLEEFEWSKKKLKYKGYPSFQQHIFSGKNEIEKVNKRRYLAYRGTLMNFFRCVQKGSFLNSRFEIFDENRIELGLKHIIDDEDNSTLLCYEGTLTVFYGDKNVGTFLKFNEDCVDLNTNGYFDPDLVTIEGFMGYFRVGDMLPFDYMPDQ